MFLMFSYNLFVLKTYTWVHESVFKRCHFILMKRGNKCWRNNQPYNLFGVLRYLYKYCRYFSENLLRIFLLAAKIKNPCPILKIMTFKI